MLLLYVFVYTYICIYNFMHLFVTVVVSAFIIALFEWCILHANRIFLNFNWIFDWLYTSVLVLYVCVCVCVHVTAIRKI